MRQSLNSLDELKRRNKLVHLTIYKTLLMCEVMYGRIPIL